VRVKHTKRAGRTAPGRTLAYTYTYFQPHCVAMATRREEADSCDTICIAEGQGCASGGKQQQQQKCAKMLTTCFIDD
jgi:hypothetical protein